ncbi:cytochrome c [Sphingobium sp. BYY-5]|uniref:cytochrome c n=1 Tax=Sphingobium sp. BYY-5 TaxID=2926400 RepID=UPI001FA6CFA3|nr:cytochrome c [Sphingobium sp. BYY-5]MCI4588940.1 cytochrome c [Sphingobium sp. BYY-5]
MKFKQRLKKLLAVSIPVLLVVGGATAWFVNRTPASPFDGQAAPRSADLVQRGEYVARASDCVACHSLPGHPAYAGGLEMPTPMGSIFATNITPDKETGIGAYSLADFDRAVRMGVARDGHRLYPAMPYPSYARLDDADVQALYAYFMEKVRPVRLASKESDIPWPLNMRWPLALWNVGFMPGEPYRADPSKDAMWNRGAYLVQAAGHCGACHTPRGIAMNEKGLDQRSGSFLSGAVINGWYAPSLRGDFNLGLARWSEEDIHRFLKTGRNQHGVVFGSMAEAFNNSTQFLTDTDLKAMAHYLKSLPGDPDRDGTPWKYETGPITSTSLGKGATSGARLYAAKCSFCHGVDGRGKAPWIPPLAGTASSLATESASSINVTLNSSQRVVANGVPDAYRMPAFREQLSDAQIADLLTFVRTSWGNKGGDITARDVEKIRKNTKASETGIVILPH